MWSNKSVEGIRSPSVAFQCKKVCKKCTIVLDDCWNTWSQFVCPLQRCISGLIYGSERKMCLHTGYVKHNLITALGLGACHGSSHFLSHPWAPFPFLFSHPPGKIVGFGKIAKWVFSQSAPFPRFPVLLSIPCLVPPLTSFFLFFPQCLAVCSAKRNHRSSEVKKRGEMRDKGVKLKGWIQKRNLFSLFDAWCYSEGNGG